MSIPAKTTPPTKPFGFLAVPPLRPPTTASEQAQALILTLIKTLGKSQPPIITETFSTPISPAIPTSNSLPCFPVPATRQTSSPFKRGFREALERKFLPPAPPTRRPSPASTEPFPIFFWMRIAAAQMTWGFVFLEAALYLILAEHLFLGLVPASSTNLLATSIREPSVPTLHPPCSRRVLKARFGLSSTAKPSLNQKNTPSSSASLRWALFSFIAGKRRNAANPQLRSRRALAANEMPWSVGFLTSPQHSFEAEFFCAFS